MASTSMKSDLIFERKVRIFEYNSIAFILYKKICLSFKSSECSNWILAVCIGNKTVYNFSRHFKWISIRMFFIQHMYTSGISNSSFKFKILSYQKFYIFYVRQTKKTKF